MTHLFQKSIGRQSPNYFRPEDDDDGEGDPTILRREKLCRRRQAVAAANRLEAQDWARQAPVLVTALPDDLRERARAYFGHPVEETGLEAYVRHQLTNYDALLTQLHRWPPAACEAGYPILRERVDTDVRTALGAFTRRPMLAARRVPIRA